METVEIICWIIFWIAITALAIKLLCEFVTWVKELIDEQDDHDHFGFN